MRLICALSEIKKWFTSSKFLSNAKFQMSFSSFAVVQPKMCDIPEDIGLSYAGPVNITVDGFPCLTWEIAQHIHYENSARTPEGNVTLAENYCRNPSQDAVGPNCYLGIGSRWNKCDIPHCCKDRSRCPNTSIILLCRHISLVSIKLSKFLLNY